MAFEKLTTVIKSGRSGLPASVSLKGIRGGGRPPCVISLSKEFAEQAKIADEQKFDLLIGTGDEQGVVRLVRISNGLLPAKVGTKGGVAFYCGHIELFGSDAQDKQFCAAELVDADTIEITLPPWAVDRE